ncbi:MAG: hypothetical protein AAFV29_23365 [Myxococcota bacterium]
MKNRDVGAVLRLNGCLWVVGSSSAGCHAAPYIPTASDADDGFIFCMVEVLRALGFEILHMQGFIENDAVLTHQELDALFKDERERAPYAIENNAPAMGD